MTHRFRIFIFLFIITLFLGYEYFSFRGKQVDIQKDALIKIREHNLNDPKFTNIPDFSKREAEVEIIEFRAFPEKLNINTERKEVLELLPMIGPKRAEEIVKYREEHGKFKSLEELIEVPAMNQTVIDEIRDYIIFNDEEKTSP
ncbi:helix-hairpin-helix domain-containing protein [bacterium]|nr:helix-hairpin-helix domain-containing protein [bacterium]